MNITIITNFINAFKSLIDSKISTHNGSNSAHSSLFDAKTSVNDVDSEINIALDDLATLIGEGNSSSAIPNMGTVTMNVTYDDNTTQDFIIFRQIGE